MREAAEDHCFQGYLTLYARPEIAHLAARVPSVMMWDDHDIFDGWGSLPERLLDGQVGRARSLLRLKQLWLESDEAHAGEADGHAGHVPGSGPDAIDGP